MVKFPKLIPMSKGVKRPTTPNSAGLPRQVDANGFRLKRQDIDKVTLTAYEQLGGADATDKSITQGKTIKEEESEGASYIIDGPLRRVQPYYFTYLTYCKLRWIDRKLIDVFVSEFRDRDAEFYRKSISAGQVTLNKIPANIESIVKNGDLISHRSYRREPPVTSRPIKIIHEDENIIAIDKPSGIPVHPTGRYRYNTVTKVMQHEMGKHVHPCNRLDRLTSGLMFMGKNAKGADEFTQQIRDRTVRKEYIARVKGEFPSDEEITVDKALITISPKLGLNRVDEENGKEATTTFKRVSYDPKSDTSIVKCRPFTGRTHQIRVHLQYLGHPIANDPIYLNEYVWGPELGKDNVFDAEEVKYRLDRHGKDMAATSWIHPQGDGELRNGETCEVSGMPLYSDPGPNDLDLWLHAYKYESADKAWSYKTEYPEWAISPHRKYMELAITLAEKCGETETMFNVGAVLVHRGEAILTGYSREIPGNTHAEQCALEKYFQNGTKTLPPGTELYTTMEPCSLRLSGSVPCVQRILDNNIKTCFVGVVEPDTFVKNNSSYGALTDKGVEYVHIPGYEVKCLEIAKRGHKDVKVVEEALQNEVKPPVQEAPKKKNRQTEHAV